MHKARAIFSVCAGLFLSALLPISADAQYSNASLDGPWLWVIGSHEAIYLVFDGYGSITDLGIFNSPSPAGSYSVAPDGAITGSIWLDESTPFTGQMQTDSTGVLSVGSTAAQVLRVMHPGACSGLWNGQFVQDSTTHLVAMTIGPSGEIQSCVGLAPPVVGRFFSQSGYLAGHLTTGGVDPVSWTPDHWGRRLPRCRRSQHPQRRTRLSSVPA